MHQKHNINLVNDKYQIPNKILSQQRHLELDRCPAKPVYGI